MLYQYRALKNIIQAGLVGRFTAGGWRVLAWQTSTPSKEPFILRYHIQLLHGRHKSPNHVPTASKTFKMDNLDASEHYDKTSDGSLFLPVPTLTKSIFTHSQSLFQAS